jgi:hypothetical protein
MIRPSGIALITAAILLSLALFVAIGILSRPHWTQGPADWDAYHAKLRTMAIMFTAFWIGVLSHNSWIATR